MNKSNSRGLKPWNNTATTRASSSAELPIVPPEGKVGRWLKANCRDEASVELQPYFESNFWSNFKASSDFAYKMARQDCVRQIYVLEQEKAKLAEKLAEEKNVKSRLARELNYLTVAMKKASITFGRIRRLSIFKMPVIEPVVELQESSETFEESSKEETIIQLE